MGCFRNKIAAAPLGRAFGWWGQFIVMGFVAAFGLSKDSLTAQSVETTPIIDGSRVGELALGYRLRNPNRTELQAVRILLPESTRVALAGEGGFFENRNDSGLFGLLPGEVYRLKITEIPFAPGVELYPTLELVGRLYPPPGRALDFPVEIFVSQEDLNLAAEGKFVTRVVYLENSLTALPVDSSLTASTAAEDTEGQKPVGKLSIDVPVGVSPLEVAETRGKVMAVFRIGSRLPNIEPNTTDPFYFGLAPFALPSRRGETK